VNNTPAILDKIKSFGFKYGTVSGVTWGIDNISLSPEKPRIIAEGKKQEDEIVSQWSEGLLSEEEKYQKIIEVWMRTKKIWKKFYQRRLIKWFCF